MSGTGRAESRLPKASPTTTQQSNLEDHGVEPKLTKWDWILPGLGEAGPDCEKNRIPPAKAICPNGDSIRYEPLRCRRVECPNCYTDEQIDRTFTVALEVEAYARVHGERPHALMASVPPDEARTWTYDELNTSLARRAYRRMRNCEVLGGFAVLHPWRIPDARKKQLRQKGYGVGGSRGGLWNGVREDALDLGDPRHYAVFGPHIHNIGYPERIEPHDGEDFVIKKYAELETLKDVVAHTRYLLSHRGVRDGEEIGRSVRPWGLFHHQGSGWDGAEEELSTDEYHELAQRIAELLGVGWDAGDGELSRETASCCPECEEPVENFFDLWELPMLADGLPSVEPWMSRLDADRRSFYQGLFEEWRKSLDDPDARGLDLDGLDVPDSVTVWSVRDDDAPVVDRAAADDAADQASPARSSQRDRRESILAAAASGATLDELQELIDADPATVASEVDLMLENGTLYEDGEVLRRT